MKETYIAKELRKLNLQQQYIIIKLLCLLSKKKTILNRKNETKDFEKLISQQLR